MKQDKELERLFKTYYQRMYWLARTMLYDADESRDAVSDVFASLAQQNTVLLPETEERYLLSSVRNRCVNAIGRKLIREQFRQNYPLDDSADEAAAQDCQRLSRLLGYAETHLSPQAQRIFRMRFVDGLTYQQIGDAMGISKVAVYKHVSQSVELLRQKFCNPKSYEEV